MPPELIFLVSASPTEFGIEAGVPCRIKISNDGEGNPLLAFVSEDLGRQLIAGRELNGEVGLLPFSKLSSDQAQESKTRNVLLFEKSEQIALYLEQGEKFDYGQLVVSFEDATRMVQNAL